VTACLVGMRAADCITDHWLPALDGRAVPAGWRAPCPVCSTPRALSIQVRGGRPVWCAHCDPSCDRAAIIAAIADRVACFSVPRRRRPAPDLAEVRALLLDTSLPPNALRLGVLVALGMGAAEAADQLKMPRRTYYDAVRILAQNRRSRGVRILALGARASSANSRAKPQVRRSLVTVDSGLTSRATLTAPGAAYTATSRDVRVRKARSSGTCPLCLGPILVGQQIASARWIAWVHSVCLIAARKAAQVTAAVPGGT
jgi:hypothetical protein